MDSTSLIRLCLVVLLATFFRTCSGEAFFLRDEPDQDPSGSSSAANTASNANSIGNNGRFGSGSGLAANGNLALAGEVHAGGAAPTIENPPADGPENIIYFPRPQDPRPPPPRMQDPRRPMPPPPPQRDSCYHGGYPHPYMDQQGHREMHRKAIEEVMWEFVPMVQKNGTLNTTSSTGPESPMSAQDPLMSQSTNQSARSLMSPDPSLSAANSSTGHESSMLPQDPLKTPASNQSSTIPRSLNSPDPLLSTANSSTGPESLENPKESNSSSSSPITQDM